MTNNDQIKRASLLCVNYHTESEIITLLYSIVAVPETVLKIYIIDNSGSFSDAYYKAASRSGLELIVLKPGRNFGYFGAVRYGLENIGEGLSGQYILIANPDLVFETTFFSRLFSLEIPSDVGVIAPRITNLPSGDQANPFLRRRPSRRWIQFRKQIHRHSYLLWSYKVLSVIKQRVRARRSKQSYENSQCEYVYAAHGSVMVFCPLYLEAGCDFNHEGFLFAEELYVAEICAEKQVRTLYCNTLEVVHHQHASIKKLLPSRASKYAFESLNFIARRFFY